jgi:ubiquinone/menaquinone biosynthesis C-methylase UbiE
METIFITLACVGGTVAAVVVWRRLFPSPMPAWFDPINTWYRNSAFPPAVALQQFSVASGQRVLELGPAGGYLTGAAAETVGPSGILVALDIQRPLLRKLRARLAAKSPPLVQGNALALPFRDTVFDVVILAGVLGELPDRVKAFAEIRRVLVAGGTLAVAEEFLLDPDYMRLSAVLRLAHQAGFEPRERFTGWFQYTQRLSRPAA